MVSQASLLIVFTCRRLGYVDIRPKVGPFSKPSLLYRATTGGKKGEEHKGTRPSIIALAPSTAHPRQYINTDAIVLLTYDLPQSSRCPLTVTTARKKVSTSAIRHSHTRLTRCFHKACPRHLTMIVDVPSTRFRLE